MHIILVTSRLSKVRSLELSAKHMALILFALGTALVGAAGLISYVALRSPEVVKLPLIQAMVQAIHEAEAKRAENFMRQNLNAMATRLGELQAQMVRLDLTGERLSSFAGLKPQDLKTTAVTDTQGGRGGPLVTALSTQNLSLNDFSRELDVLARQLDARGDYMGILDSQIFEARVKRMLLPTAKPLEIRQTVTSGFGWRLDPFTGSEGLHEGIDFLAEVGTPIHAAAGGVVIAAEYRPDYGNMVEIDHGNGYTTRYGHASKLLVKAGDVIRAGHKIALVGNTGRSTGAHLHFEVRYNGAAQNPLRFLATTVKQLALK